MGRNYWWTTRVLFSFLIATVLVCGLVGCRDRTEASQPFSGDRAAETGRMYLTATNTGITAAIDRDGRVLGELPQFKEGRLETTAQGYAGATPYVRWRDWPVLGLSLFLLAAAIVIARLRRPRG